MARVNLDIEKQLGNEFWTNRYVLDAPAFNDPIALQAAADILAAERAITYTTITFTKYRLSDNVVGTPNFVIAAVGQPGLRNPAGAAIPLWNVVRVDFSAPTGRPSRKYLRTGMGGTDITGTNLSTAYQTAITTSYLNPLLAIAAFVDVDLEPLNGGTVFLPIAMRQLRRGSKRRTAPVL